MQFKIIETFKLTPRALFDAVLPVICGHCTCTSLEVFGDKHRVRRCCAICPIRAVHVLCYALFSPWICLARGHGWRPIVVDDMAIVAPGSYAMRGAIWMHVHTAEKASCFAASVTAPVRPRAMQDVPISAQPI